MLDNTTLVLSTSNNVNVQPITVVTGLRYNAGLVKVFNNVTFLYDHNWEYQQGEPTYPLAFFFVKSMVEQMSSDVSQKPMLFYNTATDTNDATKGGLINVVADNVVIKPKTYKLDIIIPANGSSFNNTFSYDTMVSANSFIFRNGESPSTNLREASRIVNATYSIVKTLVEALYGTSISASSLVNTLLQQQDYNKASIEQMWKNRRILKLKLWNGWKFKYVVIKDCDITKTGETGDFYEGTLTCQELPILTFRNQKSSSALSILSTLSSAMGTAQKKAASTFITAMSATLGE